MSEQSGISISMRVFPIKEPQGNTLAFASVNIGEMFAASGLRIVESENGPFVAMPQSKDTKGEYHSIFHPITAESRELLYGAVMDAYNGKVAEMAQEKESAASQLQNGAKDTGAKPRGKSTKRDAPAKGAEQEV